MIVTPRLRLVPATAATLTAAIAGREVFANALQAAVPECWPPEFLDEAALRFTLDRLQESPDWEAWGMHFIVRTVPEPPLVVGTCGFKGAPSPDGAVEIGYSVVATQQRQGYATEAVQGLVTWAFNHPTVQRVIAETLPELTPSIRVLQRCGFQDAGPGSEDGVIRFELRKVDE